MAKGDPRKNNDVIEKLNTIQNLRNQLGYEKMLNDEIITIAVKERYKGAIRVKDCNSIALSNCLNSYRLKLQNNLQMELQKAKRSY